MALDAPRLATAIANAIDAERVAKGLDALTAGEKAEIEDYWEAIGGAILTEIDDNAELNSTSTGTPGVID